MKLVLASDHGGYELKEHIKSFLKDKYEIIDLGTYSTESVNYPEYGIKAGEAVANKEADLGIICCGTGLGISMAANKVKGIRAAICHCPEYASLARQHNNANILSLGGRFLSNEQAEEIVETFLNTKFEGGRHQKRVDIIINYENKN